MAHIKVTRRGSIRVDTNAATQAAAAAILKHVAQRVQEGRDVADASLPGFSDLYRQQLAAIGASASPGARLAALIRGFKLLGVTTTNGRSAMRFGTGNAQVASAPRPPPWVFDRSKTPAQRSAAMSRWRSSPKKQHSHSASVVLRWLASPSRGRARRLVGVSPRGRSAIIQAIERARIFVSR